MKKYYSKLFFSALVLVLSVALAFSGCVSSQPSGSGGNGTQNQSKEPASNSENGTQNQNKEPASEEEFLWTAGEGGIIILEYIGDDTEVIVPEIINNKKVVSIGNTFDGNVVITSLSLPSGVKEFKLSGCDSLKILTLNAEEINGGDIEFSDMPVLEELNLVNAKEIYAISHLVAKKLYAPVVTVIDNREKDAGFKYADPEWSEHLEEVVLPDNLNYVIALAVEAETGEIAMEVGIRNEGGDQYSIADEKESFYCWFFNNDELIVNGVKFTK